MYPIDNFLTIRQRMRAFGEGLSAEALLQIPKGFNNNIAWNLGHVAVTQQLLCYKLSGLPMRIDAKLVELFGKDSAPAKWSEAPDMQQVLPLLTELAEGFRDDLGAGIFKQFTPYSTSLGVELKNIDQAIAFNQFHEGIHLGYAMAQRRALG